METCKIRVFKYTLRYFTPHGKIWTQLIDRSPNVRFHSSVGRASHRYRGSNGFESRWSPDFFRLLLSNCFNWNIYCDDPSSIQEFYSENSSYSKIVLVLWTLSNLLFAVSGRRVRSVYIWNVLQPASETRILSRTMKICLIGDNSNFSPNRIRVVAVHVWTMEPVKLDSPVKDIAVSVFLDSQEQTVNKLMK